MTESKSHQSAHYLIRYGPDSHADSIIEDIAETQEHCFNHIVSMLSAGPQDPIEYYLYDTPEEVGMIHGDGMSCDGFARYPNEIHAVCNHDNQCLGYHEDVHLIAYREFGTPSSCFIREGLAMCFDQVWWGMPNIAWLLFYLERDKTISLLDMFEDNYFNSLPCHVTYPIAGAFTTYLVTRYGMSAYRHFYAGSAESTSLSFESNFGILLSNSMSDFILSLNPIHLDNALIEAMHRKLASTPR